MHILHAIDTLHPGGAQRSLVDIANQTREAGAAVSVCATRSGCEMAAELEPGIDVLVLGRKRRFDWAAMYRFSQWIQAKSVDVIHSHGRTTFSLLAFLKAFGWIRHPLVMHDHTGKARPEVSAPLWFRAWARRYIAHYVGVCAEMDAWAAHNGIPGERRSVIPGALNLRDERRRRAPILPPRATVLDADTAFVPRGEFGVPPGVLLGICLGGVRPEKGIDTLLAAVARARTRGAFRIVVVGGVRNQTYWDFCLRETRRLGIENEVVFAGERTGVREWLGGFDFAVHAARSESGPLVLIEHLDAALPVICTRVGGIAQRAEQLGAERFVPADDPDQLSAALDELVSATPHQRSERGARGRGIARSHFDIRAVMPAWARVYEKATGIGFPVRRVARTAA